MYMKKHFGPRTLEYDILLVVTSQVDAQMKTLVLVMEWPVSMQAQRTISTLLELPPLFFLINSTTKSKT